MALLLSVVTGLGHFYLDHYLTGAVLFGLFATALNGIFLGFTLQAAASPEMLRAVSIFCFVVVWTFGFWHAYRLSFGTDRAALAQAKDQLLREGLIDYLRDDLEDAARKIERAAALDVDWVDPDPLFHLGVVSSRLAERRAARGDVAGAKLARRRALTSFRGCLSRDPARKWRAEVAEELRRMNPGTFTGRMRKMGGALRSALETASGMFVRPSAAALRGAELVPAATPLGETPSIREAITQTRKKKRFSAKYPALPRPEAEARTHADLRLGAATPAPAPGAADEPPPETKADLRLDAPADHPERSAARRFPLKDITQALAVHDGQLQQLEPPSPPAPDGPEVTLQAAVVEEPAADEGDEDGEGGAPDAPERDAVGPRESPEGRQAGEPLA